VVGGGRPGGVPETREIGLAGQFARKLGRMKPTGEEPAADAIQEPLETSLQVPHNVHDG
jgi:hypothetical protein